MSYASSVIDKLSLSSNWELTGQIDEESIPQVYSAATLKDGSEVKFFVNCPVSNLVGNIEIKSDYDIFPDIKVALKNHDYAFTKSDKIKDTTLFSEQLTFDDNFISELEGTNNVSLYMWINATFSKVVYPINNLPLLLKKLSRLCKMKDAQAKKNTRLHLAAQLGDMQQIDLAIKAGVSVNQRDEYHRTPLHYSTSFDHLEATEALLDAGAIPSIADNFGVTPIHNAAAMTTSKIIKRLVELGADTNLKTTHGARPIHMAASSGNSDTIKLLLQNGAKIEVTDNLNFTPLHVAITMNNLKTTQVLLQLGADIHVTNYLGDSASSLADLNDPALQFSIIKPPKSNNNNKYLVPVSLTGH